MLRMSAGKDGIPYLGPASHVPQPNCTVVRTSDHPSPVGSDREAIYDFGVSTVDDDRRDVCRLNRRGWYQANNQCGTKGFSITIDCACSLLLKEQVALSRFMRDSSQLLPRLRLERRRRPDSGLVARRCEAVPRSNSIFFHPQGWWLFKRTTEASSQVL